MTRLFLSRKDPAQEETNLAKRRFTFFRRGQSDVAPSSPTTASMSPPQSPARSLPADPPRRSLFTPVPVQKKTQSFRISVYEVRKDGDLTDTCSSSGSDQENVGATLRRRGLAEKKTARAKSPLPKSEPSPSSATRKAPQRTFSDPFLGASRESPPRGILKQGLITTASTRPAAGPTPVTSFDLEIARQSTSLTDAASATGDSKATSTPLKKLPEPSFVTKRTVSFSADVRDPNPRSPTMYSMCWGGKAGRRVPRKSFSLFNEFEDLSYDLTYFCRCIAEVATGHAKGNDLLADDDSTVGSGSLLDEASSVENPIIQASVTM